jgi:hypothetical protein
MNEFLSSMTKNFSLTQEDVQNYQDSIDYQRKVTDIKQFFLQKKL